MVQAEAVSAASAQPNYGQAQLHCFSLLKSWLMGILMSCSSQMDQPVLVAGSSAGENYDQQQVSTVCRGCGDEKEYGESLEYTIPLPFGPGQNIHESLSTLVFGKEEEFNCIKCGGDHGAMRKTLLDALPDVMAFRVGRYDDNDVEFEGAYYFPTLLDMHDYNGGLEGFEYTLYGVIVHVGDTRHRGHWICFVKSADKWTLYDDERVENVPEDNVLKQQPYMLLYVKVKIVKSSELDRAMQGGDQVSKELSSPAGEV